MLLPHLNTIWLEKQIHLFDSYKPVIAFSQWCVVCEILHSYIHTLSDCFVQEYAIMPKLPNSVWVKETLE